MYFGVDYYPEHWEREEWESQADLMKEGNFNIVRIERRNSDMLSFKETNLKHPNAQFLFSFRLSAASDRIKESALLVIKEVLSMTSTQVQYWSMKEAQKHNRATELQAQNELSETGRHNIETEKASHMQARASMSQADSARMNAESNRMNVAINQQNADTNKYNADINARNADTNAYNADINARNADTNARNADINAKNAVSNRMNARSNQKQASAAVTTAKANVSNAKTNRMNAYTNKTNAQTNIRNAATNERMASIAEQNAATNALEAATHAFQSKQQAQRWATQNELDQINTALTERQVQNYTNELLLKYGDKAAKKLATASTIEKSSKLRNALASALNGISKTAGLGKKFTYDKKTNTIKVTKTGQPRVQMNY